MAALFKLVLLLSAMATATAQCGTTVTPTGDPVYDLNEAGRLLDKNAEFYDIGTTQTGAQLIALNPLAYANTAQGCYDHCVANVPTLYTDLVGFSFYINTGDNNLNQCTCYRQDPAKRTAALQVETFGAVTSDASATTTFGCAYCIGCKSFEPSSQPSSQPSGMPSSNPSEAPSGQPSSNPSEAPSGQPSAQPSGQPSNTPSEAPSGQPSAQPSGMPSSSPSEAPSGQPSSLPSRMPSSSPSESPSGQPSSTPSLQPSSVPSEAPSGQPSSIPSEQPTSQPSGQPTSQPSGMPSEQPSCTPSSAPTDPETMHLYYPDWSPGGAGCLNDGNQPNYMDASPSWYLHSSIEDCCSTYFGWNYDACIGNLPGICARALWYPDWEGANEGCIDDGNEPPYMTDNFLYYMFSKREDCCAEHYNWNYEECVGKSLNILGLYYPDFDDQEHICKNDGLQPKYMNNSPDVWMHDQLVDCCSANYQWNYDACMGSSPGAAPGPTPATATGSGLWYPDWLSTDHVCRNDGNEPVYMANNPTNWMFDTQVGCCQKNYQWNYDECMGVTATGAAPSPTPATTGSGRFYMNWTKGYCVQDCDGAYPCSGRAQNWDYLYDTLKICCDERNWWNEGCESGTVATASS